jgi:hypothetical protein
VHTSPRESPLTSCESLLSKNARLQGQKKRNMSNHHNEKQRN